MTNLEAEVDLVVKVKKYHILKYIIPETMMEDHKRLKVPFNDFQTFNRHSWVESKII